MNKLAARFSTPCGLVRSEIPIRTAPLPITSTSPPSNCHELLFDDVLAVEAAGEEHDAFATTLRNQDVEVLLLHDLLVETLAVAQAREWLLNTQISDFRYGPTFARDLREYLAQM